MKLKIISRLAAIALSMAAVLNSCNDESFSDYGSHGDSESAHVVLRLKTPGNYASPSTRGLTQEQESVVKTVHILGFKGSGNNLTLDYVASGKTPVQNPGTSNKATFETTLPTSTDSSDTYKLMVVANAKEIIETVFGTNLDGYTGDKGIAAIQQLLKAKIEGKMYAAGGMIAMWGATDFVEIKENTTLDLKMTRAVARVDVGVGTAVAQSDGTYKWSGKDASNNVIPFVLEQIHIIQPSKGYAIMPELAKFSNDKADAPSLVVTGEGAGKFTVDDSKDKFNYSGADIKSEGGGSWTSQSIYLPESDIKMGAGSVKPGDSNHKNRMAVVVGGSYAGGGTSYYRLDFVSNKSLLDVLRNYLYQFNIKSVSGSGYATPEEAYESLSMNMTAEVLQWNEANLDDVVFDGQYYLSIEEREVTLSPMGDETIRLNVKTNISDWKLFKNDTPSGYVMDASKGNVAGGRVYTNTTHGFEYTIGGTMPNYTLTIHSQKHNVSKDVNPRTEDFEIHAKRLSLDFSVKQTSTDIYISMTNGQTIHLYPEGTDYSGLNSEVIDIVSVDEVTVAANAPWILNLPTNLPLADGVYKAKLRPLVNSWPKDLGSSTDRTGKITITPRSKAPITINLMQEAPYMSLNRTKIFLNRQLEGQLTEEVWLETNISPLDWKLTPDPTNLTEANNIVNLDNITYPSNSYPRHARVPVKLNMDLVKPQIFFDSKYNFTLTNNVEFLDVADQVLSVELVQRSLQAFPYLIAYSPSTGKLECSTDSYSDDAFTVGFKFGSVIAFTSGQENDLWATSSVVFDPTKRGNAYYSTYSQIMAYTGTTIVDNIHTVANITTAGWGDPCRLVGLTIEEARSGVEQQPGKRWRLPNRADNETLVGSTSSFTPDWTTDDPYNMDEVYSGVWFPKGKREIWLPATGYRHSNGTVIQQGEYGGFWTSQSANPNYGRLLMFSKTNVSPFTGDEKNYGNFVRCVPRN